MAWLYLILGLISIFIILVIYLFYILISNNKKLKHKIKVYNYINSGYYD